VGMGKQHGGRLGRDDTCGHGRGAVAQWGRMGMGMISIPAQVPMRDTDQLAQCAEQCL